MSLASYITSLVRGPAKEARTREIERSLREYEERSRINKIAIQSGCRVVKTMTSAMTKMAEERHDPDL